MSAQKITDKRSSKHTELPSCFTCGHSEDRHKNIKKIGPDQFCIVCPGNPSDLTGPARHMWNAPDESSCLKGKV